MGAGVARARVGDLGMASEALGEANRLNASDASIKVALASALKLNGDPERALEFFEKRRAATRRRGALRETARTRARE